VSVSLTDTLHQIPQGTLGIWWYLGVTHSLTGHTGHTVVFGSDTLHEIPQCAQCGYVGVTHSLTHSLCVCESHPDTQTPHYTTIHHMGWLQLVGSMKL